MNRKVITITLNPAYDLVGSCPKIELGDVNLVQTLGLHAAGKGINVAKVLSDLRLDVTVSGFLGDQNQEGFIQLFDKLGMNNQFHAIKGRTRINVKLTTENSEVTELNFSGFTVTDADWDRFVESSLNNAKQADMVVISGSLPSGILPDVLTHWMKKLKEQCPLIVFDSSREALASGIKAHPWLIKPNDKELAMWAGKPLTTINEIKSAAQELVRQGIENIVVSLGQQGALWVTSQETWLAKPPVCEVVSTVGAGDSMVAGLIYGSLRQQPIKQTFCLASAIAALSVAQSGVGITDHALLTEMMSKIELIAM